MTPPAPLLLNDGTHFPLSREEYLDGYVNQVTFLNSELQEMLLSIMDRSATPPIIILQADHGPGSMLDWENIENTNATERLAIFAAYLVPDDIPIQIPETMTPVNAFRILSNAILGTDSHPELDPHRERSRCRHGRPQLQDVQPQDGVLRRTAA